jgi:DNA-binding NtrC family response regulator
VAVILIVEDEQLLLWSIKRRLEGLRHDVLEAASLAEAAAHVGRVRPDLVILDLSLPDGYGLDFLEQHREHLQAAPVLVVTAVGDAADAARAAELGAVEFLTKPVAHDELARLVSRYLELPVSTRR